MIKTNIMEPTECRNIKMKCGCFSLLEYEKDYSVFATNAQTAYFASKMNVHKRQVIAELNDTGIILQSGDMQMIIGNISASTNIKGAGDFMKKFVSSKVTGESAVKPRYTGKGLIVLEPTYSYILFQNLDDWNGKMVVEDGMFKACDDTVDIKVVARSTLSSAAFGGEGLFNTALVGKGIVVLESPVPQEELIVIDLEDDVVRIDGNMAIAWSDSLKFTVEKVTGSMAGSVASGEGFVNVYRGTGRVIMAPVNQI